MRSLIHFGNDRIAFVMCLLAMTNAFSGCGIGGRRAVKYDQPEAAVSGAPLWETVWVEPRIMFSDSLVTLIKADRIDSIYVPEPDQRLEVEPPAAKFRVSHDGCVVTAVMLDSRGQVRLPLMVRSLPMGHYSLALDFSLLPEGRYPPGDYIIKVDICGTVLSRIVRRRL